MIKLNYIENAYFTHAVSKIRRQGVDQHVRGVGQYPRIFCPLGLLASLGLFASRGGGLAAAGLLGTAGRQGRQGQFQ